MVVRSVSKVLLLAAVVLGAVVTANAVVLAGGRGDRHDPGPLDAALVLGAGVRPDGSPSDVLRDRLDEALSLRAAGRVRKILVSGDHGEAGYDEPNAMRR